MYLVCIEFSRDWIGIRSRCEKSLHLAACSLLTSAEKSSRGVMRRDQLEHAIRTACQIIDAPEVIVAGSQAILASYSEEELPEEATMSMEVDVLPIADDNEEVIRLADQIEGVAGELSSFEETHGFSIDGIDLSTAALP